MPRKMIVRWGTCTAGQRFSRHARDLPWRRTPRNRYVNRLLIDFGGTARAEQSGFTE